MVKQNLSDRSETSKKYNPSQYSRLKAEAAAPYRGLRKFMYISFGASGLIGAFIFGLQAIALRDIENALPNLALQLGLVALMVFLWRWDRQKNQK